MPLQERCTPAFALAQGRRRHNGGVETIERYVAGLGLDAYLVGGAVRDELLGRESKDADFLVPGVDTPALRDALYSQTHPRLQRAAERNVLAHLMKLEADGKVTRREALWAVA